MRTVLATFTVSESGSVTTETYVDESTYQHWVPLSHYGSPYLGSYETSEEWRAALGAYAVENVKQRYGVNGLHGEHLVYVSPQCSLYVYAVDFDF